MGRQAFRLDARRTVAEAMAVKKRERVEQERRQVGLAVTLMSALAERDLAIATTETNAGNAVLALLRDKLGVEEIAELCAGQIPAKEVARLAQVAKDAAHGGSLEGAAT